MQKLALFSRFSAVKVLTSKNDLSRQNIQTSGDVHVRAWVWIYNPLLVARGAPCFEGFSLALIKTDVT